MKPAVEENIQKLKCLSPTNGNIQYARDRYINRSTNDFYLYNLKLSIYLFVEIGGYYLELL